mmetsp:Transcript_24343/g.48427  ORF Transcript_24343/g.48427 Transcript_24343/m.48427 type:complete len:205 (+) Transcript_24343:639-1253(+)
MGVFVHTQDDHAAQPKEGPVEPFQVRILRQPSQDVRLLSQPPPQRRWLCRLLLCQPPPKLPAQNVPSRLRHVLAHDISAPPGHALQEEVHRAEPQLCAAGTGGKLQPCQGASAAQGWVLRHSELRRARRPRQVHPRDLPPLPPDLPLHRLQPPPQDHEPHGHSPRRARARRDVLPLHRDPPARWEPVQLHRQSGPLPLLGGAHT